MKFNSRVECVNYFSYLEELGASRILFFYEINTGTRAPLFLTETETECTVKVSAAFIGDPPDGFLDHVQLFTGFDPSTMPS